MFLICSKLFIGKVVLLYGRKWRIFKILFINKGFNNHYNYHKTEIDINFIQWILIWFFSFPYFFLGKSSKKLKRLKKLKRTDRGILKERKKLRRQKLAAKEDTANVVIRHRNLNMKLMDEISNIHIYINSPTLYKAKKLWFSIFVKFPIEMPRLQMSSS